MRLRYEVVVVVVVMVMVVLAIAIADLIWIEEALTWNGTKRMFTIVLVYD